MNILLPLKHPAYRCFFLGQIASMAGTTMQAMVQGWLAFQLTHSTAWLGILLCCQQGVSCLMSPWVGRIADLHDRRKLFIVVELGAMLQALALAACVHWQVISATLLAFLSMLLGVLMAFELTLRHAMVADLVGPRDLKHGVFLNSVTLNLARVLGPFGATLMIGGDSLQWTELAFMANGLSYALVAIFVGLSLHWPSQSLVGSATPAKPEKKKLSLKVLAADHPEIATLLLISSFLSFVCYPYQVLLPAFAQKALFGGPTELSWLAAAAGLGAIFSCLSSPSESFMKNPMPHLGYRVVALSFAMLGFARSDALVPACCSLAILGYCLHGAYPLINCAIQQRCDNHHRARFISMYSMTTLGPLPLGSLLFGRLADVIGPEPTCLVAALITLLMGALSFPRLRKVVKRSAMSCHFVLKTSTKAFE